MSRIRNAALVAAITFGSVSSIASAGFLATLGPTTVAVNATVLTTNTPGTILAFVPDGPTDPQITGADLNHYKLQFTGTAITPGALTGTYQLFYDLALDGQLSAGDPVVSGGSFLFTAGALNADGAYPLDGTLTQAAQFGAPFADLSYGGSPISFTGFYRPVDATISGVLVQSAVVPEPTNAALALPALAMLRRRR